MVKIKALIIGFPDSTWETFPNTGWIKFNHKGLFGAVKTPIIYFTRL